MRLTKHVEASVSAEMECQPFTDHVVSSTCRTAVDRLPCVYHTLWHQLMELLWLLPFLRAP